MTSALSKRWIVIPPCADRAAWLSIVTAQVQKTGLTVIDRSHGSPANDPDDAILIVQDIDVAHKAGARDEDLAVIFSRAGLLPPEIDATEERNVRHHEVLTASELVRKARASAPAARQFEAVQFDTAPIEVLPGVRLAAPPVEQPSSRNQALQEALSLYKNEPTFWHGEVFDYIASSVQHVGEQTIIDLTGRPRIVFYGPYIVVPAGRWKVTMRIGFCHQAARRQYRADWGGQHVYASHHFKPEKDGLFELEMEHEWTEPAPCEMRLLVMEGVFDGQLLFYGAHVSRIV